MRTIWHNGSLKPESAAKVSVYDSALMFGDTVFEMTRTFNGKQFKLREHLERLYRSVRYVQIPLEMTIEEMEQACYEVQDANEFEPDDEHRLMINVSRGVLPMYQETDSHHGPNVIITDFPLRWTVAGMGHLFDVGINAVIPSQRAIPAYLLDPKVKSRSRLYYQMANIEVSRCEGKNNWPLLLDDNGFVTESTGANFFIGFDDVLWTSRHTNCLNGISREYVLCNWPMTQEYVFTTYDILNSEEAFFTATPFCMLPVTSLNGIPIGDGHPGSIYNTILGRWSEDVGVDIKAQIQAWDKGRPEGPSAYSFK